MAQKCVHKGCGKTFSDPEEPCVYHPGPPIFHEGQKGVRCFQLPYPMLHSGWGENLTVITGWKCCKPRFLTFDEFLSIPPCTTGKHSTVEEQAPDPDPKPSSEPLAPKPLTANTSSVLDVPVFKPITPAITPTSASPTPVESESDDPSLPIPAKATCRRKGCNVSSTTDGQVPSNGEECIYHPGQPLFHEGSKGWTCCKKRVLEFDEFLKLPGCKRRNRHLFRGKKKSADAEEEVSEVRNDFYQTPTSVIASFYIKKVDKDRARIEFTSPTTVLLDLPTLDKRRYSQEVPLFGPIDTAQSSSKVMGTKVELNLVKSDGSGWPTLRSDEQGTGEIIQTGRAGRA